MFVFCVDGHVLSWYNSTVIIIKHYKSITSYNFGNKARAFLPSYRKWLDYEVIENRTVEQFTIDLFIMILTVKALNSGSSRLFY